MSRDGARRDGARRDASRRAAGWSGSLARIARAGAGLAKAALAREALPLTLAAVLVGRATVLQAISPFGLAFFAAVLASWPRRAPGVAVATALGILWAGAPDRCLEFAAGAAGLGLLQAFFEPSSAERGARTRSSLTLAALAFTVTVVAGCVKAFFLDPTPYRFLLAFFSGLLTFVLTLVYLAGLPAVFASRRPVAVGPEQVIAAAVATATALAGLGGLGYQGVALSAVGTGILILAAAAVCGGGVGAAVGAVAGAVGALSAAGGLSAVGLWSLSGLLAGSFRDFGRLGTAAGYFFGALLLSPLVEEATYLRSSVLESALAAGLFLVLPGRALEALRLALGRTGADDAGDPVEDLAREDAGKKLLDLSLVFGQLSATLRETSPCGPPPEAGGETPGVRCEAPGVRPEVPGVRPEASGVWPADGGGAPLSGLAEAASRVCQACRLFRSCWKGGAERARGAMAALLEVTRERGQLEARDIPAQVRKRCVHLGELVTTMNFLHEISVLNRHWRRKLDESRALVHQQLDGVAAVLRSLGEGLRADAAGDLTLAEELARRFDRVGFPFRRVAAVSLPEGKVEFHVTADSCESGDACRELALPEAGVVSRQGLALFDVRCGFAAGRPDCSFRLGALRRLEYKIGVAQARKASSGVSGDSYMIRELPGNRLAAVLSDGTGAGPRAAEESRTTIRMLEELFRVGFGTELTVRTINSVLLMRSAQERFATLDLVTVDLDLGQARFVKVGAPPSYVRRGREVRVVEAANLPLGVVPDVSAEGRMESLGPGDLVVLATDGLVSAGAERADGWVPAFLRDIGEASPQETADALVEAAVSLGGRRLPAVAGGSAATSGYRGLGDDVTVLALKFGPPEGT